MTKQQTSSALRMSACSNTSNFHSSTNTSSSTAEQSFSSYLTSISSQVQKNLVEKNDTVESFNNIIMGNEAGDADSIISSLALAYVKSMEKKDASDECTNFTPIPVISVNRDDMPLRRDVVQLLRMAGIDNYEELIYLDDPWPLSIMGNADTSPNESSGGKSISLVDHNKIRSNLWHLEQYVEEIFDHHQDENFHLDSVKIREVAFSGQKALVGSTCTLIVERMMKTRQSSAKSNTSDQYNLDAGLGIALLGVILLDTMNMNPEASKGTERDESAIDYLMNNSDWEMLRIETKEQIRSNRNNELMVPDRAKLYEYIRDSKFDRTFWKEMSARDAMRIDYKRFEPTSSSSDGKSNDAFGLSSVLLDLDDMLVKKDFLSTAVKFMNEFEVGTLGIMCMVIVDDRPQRELLLIGDASSEVESLATYLTSDNAAEFLDISLVEDFTETAQQDAVDGYTIKRFQQGNPKGSRKQLAPLILSFFSS
eukprot:CAMPEP_0203675222 /NCGR_PEP_ID=MMETSP0090-20130426/19580_1 /ASSEMBLY_ACC=CAM_ASM_001088 /TAXON_ID=426623 /ORGANISM="Chaetoceros affinis, Strain CCMP159" /LENGTH=479 /DNA_ID=CAMNT_0050541347 /DNA_START=109 /DNA_END=1548 /DNA_ORIENTATION=-